MTTWIADVGTSSGINGYYQTERLANSLTKGIISDIKTLEPYVTLTNIIGSNITDSYFTAEIKTLIWPLVKDYVICINNTNLSNPSLTEHILVKRPFIYDLLTSRWPKTGPQLECNNNWEWLSQIKYAMKIFAKNTLDMVPTVGFNTPKSQANRIGVECCRNELLRNSILRWIDNLETDRTTLCLLKSTGFISSQDLHAVRSDNILTVDLDKKASEGIHDYWRTGIGKKHTLRKYQCNKATSKHSPIEKWINRRASILLRRVDYWRKFFTKNQIKVYVHYTVEHEEGIAKQIALNLEGGILVFIQRSHMVSVGGSIARRSCHVCFCWGNPVYAIGTHNHNNIDFYVISGANDKETTVHAKSLGHSYRNKVSTAGAKFVISIFDNASSPNIMYGETALNDFYTYLLRWVMNDQDNGLIIKPKKNLALQLANAHQIHHHQPHDRISIAVHKLLIDAVATGRCLILDESDAPECAAYAADISVGLGYSTAITRSAIENLRGIHCDLSKNPDDHLQNYLNTLMFNDLDSIMEAITTHKQHVIAGDVLPSLIGDHSAIVKQLDPFQDGKATDRIADYLSYLIQGYDHGYSKDLVIESANKKFVSKWGEDKVISNANTFRYQDHE